MSTTEQKPQAENKGSATGGLYSISLPVSQTVLVDALRMVADPRVRKEELNSLICQDPAIALELLKVSNSMMFSAGRPPVTSIRGALERLGVDASIEALDKLNFVPAITEARQAHWVNVVRNRCKNSAKIAKFFAESLAMLLQEDCEVAALLVLVGEMLAPLNFKEKFTKMADEQKTRTKIIFRLEKDFQFDPIKVGVNYLRRAGLPEMVLFAVDEESSQKLPARLIMRPICKAAAELAIAIEEGKFEKYAPGSSTIPPKSAIRILKMTESQYKTIYDKIAEFFAADLKKDEAAAAV